MKRLLPILGMICTLSSCIYDSPNDNFYRTLWVSEELPFSELGELSDGRITIEFLCGGSISVTAAGAAGSYGTYQPYGNTAYFAGLTLTYYGDQAAIISTYREAEDDEGTKATYASDLAILIIEEAHRTDDILLVSWHREGSPTSYSTRFIRHSSYESNPRR